MLCAAVTFLLDLTAIVLGITTHRGPVPVVEVGCRYGNRMAIAMGFFGLLGSGTLASLGIAFGLAYAQPRVARRHDARARAGVQRVQACRSTSIGPW